MPRYATSTTEALKALEAALDDLSSMGKEFTEERNQITVANRPPRITYNPRDRVSLLLTNS